MPRITRGLAYWRFFVYQVIARKYRPRSFSELIGQEHVRTTLENALSSGRIAHGYIFSGQRGTGKTTVARIVARCLNCEQGPTITPCGVCASCSDISGGGGIDVIEIDAASNRGINEMRELRESVRFQPARDRFKIFIIDEAHQITNEAFNALLKTLEEPPEWVVFMLCTTESHKIPNTIASRCQQFSFRSVDYDIVLQRVKWICEQEGITAEEEALSVITLAGEGSVRDSLSALDQAIACCGGKLTAPEVRQLLGRFSMQTLERTAVALRESDAKGMLELVQELESGGQNLQHFCREWCRYLRNLLVARVAGQDSRLIAASNAERERLGAVTTQFSEEDLTRYLNLSLAMFKDLHSSLQPRMHLELGLVRMVHAGRMLPIEEAIAALGNAPMPQAPPAAKPAPRSNPAPAAQPPPPPVSGSLAERLLATLTAKGMSFIADAVEHSRIVEKPAEIEFITNKEFAMAVRSKDMQSAVDAAAGRTMRIKVTLTESAAATPAPERAARNDDATGRALANPEVQRFRELFPGSEVRTVRNLSEN